MRCALLLLVVTVLLFSIAPLTDAKNISAKAISEVIQMALPTEFGYVDNTEYAMKHELSVLTCVNDSHVVVCAEATNFNEFGVFYVENERDVKRCVKQLTEYVARRKAQFQNGVIYDINEYPKFENAKVTAIGRYVIYTILETAQKTAAIQAVEHALQQKATP